MSHNLWSTGHSDIDSPFLSTGTITALSGNPAHQQNLERLKSCAHQAQQRTAGQDTKRSPWHQSLLPRHKESMSQLHNQSLQTQYLFQHQDITLGAVENRNLTAHRADSPHQLNAQWMCPSLAPCTTRNNSRAQSLWTRMQDVQAANGHLPLAHSGSEGVEVAENLVCDPCSMSSSVLRVAEAISGAQPTVRRVARV